MIRGFPPLVPAAFGILNTSLCGIVLVFQRSTACISHVVTPRDDDISQSIVMSKSLLSTVLTA